MGVLGLSIVGISTATWLITIPASITTIVSQNALLNPIHFNRWGNSFQWAIIWNGTQTLNTPQSVTYGSTTLSCNKKVAGIYYNNQRWARRRPLDSTTRTALINTDSSYSNIQLSGWLFTDCGWNTNAVYGQITHIVTWSLSGEYKLAAGLIYDFANNIYQTTGTSNSLILTNNQWSWYVYDSAGWIWVIIGGATSVHTNTTQIPSNNNKWTVATLGTWLITPPTTKLCQYADIDYAGKGPFTDTLGHRGFDYIEILRISCLNQGRWVKKWLRIYEPNANITRAEVLKTVSKILGSSFGNLEVTNEQNIYNGNKPFADTPNWFNHYADYAFKNGLTEGLYSVKDGKMYLDPDKAISRYEAIKIMMLAYNKISQSMVDISQPSVMGDVVDANNPYYSYVRQAETLWFISGVPKANDGYNFEGIRNLTRAEFAKIVGLPFADQLFEIDQVIYQSELYQEIIDALNTTTSNRKTFIQELFAQISELSEDTFIKKYKVPKKPFLEVLYETVVAPILGS